MARPPIEMGTSLARFRWVVSLEDILPVSLDELIAKNIEPAVPCHENDEMGIGRLQEMMKRCGLGPEQRTAVVLHYCVGYTAKEVAVITETPLETVRSRLRLAKEKLRNVLKKEGSR